MPGAEENQTTETPTAPAADVVTDAGNAEPASSTNDGGTVDVAALLADNERLRASLADVRDEAAKRRISEREANDKAIREAEENGRTAEALRLTREENERLRADLEAARPGVEAGQAFESYQSGRIAKALENGAPEHLKAVLRAEGVPLEVKVEALDAYQATSTATAASPGGPETATPAPTVSTSPAGSADAGATNETVESLLAKGWNTARIRRDRPDVFARAVQESSGAGRGTKRRYGS